MRLVTLLLSAVFLAGCTSSSAQQFKTPWDEWYFAFTTPKALPAQVTLVYILATDSHFYTFRNIDQPNGLSVGQWDKENSASNIQFNKAKELPKAIKFCWDSIIDKKVYETTMVIEKDTWEKMITPYPDVLNPEKDAYRQTLIIGLAPEGVVRTWLRQYGNADIPLNSTKIKTVSGDALDMCKGVTKSDFSYGYDEDIKEFIKGKKYPYGNW